MVVVLSPSSVESKEVMAEWNFFATQDLPMFPVIAKDCDVPILFSIYQMWDLTKDYGKQVIDLSKVLSRITGGPPPSVTKPKPHKWKILLYTLLPIIVLATVLFVWPGCFERQGSNG